MKALVSIGAIVASSMLTACGPLYSHSVSQEMFLDKLGEVVSGRADKEAIDPRSVLTRAELDETDATIVLTELPARESIATQAITSVNGNKVTWSGGDDTQFTTQQGFLIATRALGEDLMWVDVEGFGAALGRASGSTYQRKMAWLGSMDEIRVEEFTCTLAAQGADVLEIVGKRFHTRVYRDECVGSSQHFENVYWIDSERKVRKSRQYVSESVGYLLIERLN